MTGRATFGEFAAAADRHLARALSLAAPVTASRTIPVRTRQAHEVGRGMGRVVAILDRYVADITAASLQVSPRQMDHLTPWMRAGIEARTALTQAAAALAGDRQATAESGSGGPVSPAAQEFGAAITAMTVGRDLLQTHLSVDASGTREHRSEWAPVVLSVPVAGALLLEVGRWARMAALSSERLPMTQITARKARRNSDVKDLVVAQRRLVAASQSLLKVHWAIQRAQERQPVSAADTRLLHAIPANMLPVRRRPANHESAADLYRGTSDCAERTRYTAHVVAPLASWSPYLTGESLRENAASATAISHHCSIALRVLSARAFHYGYSATSAQLSQSAEAAERARDAWLATARMWELATTETRGLTSPVTAETADLALWTGRLAFADSGWSLAQGPVQRWRSPESLCPRFRDLPTAVAATHQACDALVQLAAADHEQVCRAAWAGRLYSPTRTLPDDLDVPRPFTRTPKSRVNRLLDVYRGAHEASVQTTALVAAVAEAVRAPSSVLATARTAARATSTGLQIDAAAIGAVQVADPEAGLTESPGHFERILAQLGETDPTLVKRAAAIDLAGEQLMIESARTCMPWHEVDTDRGRDGHPDWARRVPALDRPSLEAEL